MVLLVRWAGDEAPKVVSDLQLIWRIRAFRAIEGGL